MAWNLHSPAAMRPLIIFLVLTWSAGARAQEERILHQDVQRRWSRTHDRISARILGRETVRAPSSATVQRMIATPENQRAREQGEGLLHALVGQVKGNDVRRGIRRGYGATDIEYRGKNLSARLGLRPGQGVVWSTTRAQIELRAETSGRVVVTSRPHDRYLNALRDAVNGIVSRVANDPDHQLTAKEQRRLALAPTDMRAEALARVGFKLRREEHGKGLKYELEVPGERGLKVFSRVFTPGVSTYLPGKGHSQYIHSGWVVDFMFASREHLRTTNRTVYPVMLGGREAARMDTLVDSVLNRGWDMGVSTQGSTDYTRGRPPGYWPPRPGVDKKTGNTCTTTHHRAPVGSRLADFRWLDALDRSGLVQGSLLDAVSAAHGQQRVAKIDELMVKAGGQTREQLRRLRGIVEQYNGMQMTDFPLQLLGRRQLKDLMGVPFNPAHRGTTDPVGPGFARPMYSGAPERIPVVVKLKKD